MNFFGLPLKGANLVDVEISHSPGLAELNVADLGSASIRHGLIPPEPLELERFDVFPCFTGATRASEVMVLRFGGGENRDTFGFVFPTTAFRNENELDERFLLIYADAAFRGFATTENISKFQSGRKWQDIVDNSLEMDEAFSENLSILVVSKEVLAKHNVDSDLLDLILRRECISICASNTDLSLSPSIAEFKGTLNFQLPKLLEADVVKTLTTLLKNADHDNSEIGKFIQLYQFFEYMLKMVFEWGIPEASGEGLSAWEVKERLTTLGREKHRLKLIHTKCTPGLKDRVSQSNIQDICERFLGLISMEFKVGQPWYSQLYKVRSCIVHNQFSMLRPECTEELGHLNAALRRVALDMLFNFEKPEAGTFFQTDQEDQD